MVSDLRNLTADSPGQNWPWPRWATASTRSPARTARLDSEPGFAGDFTPGDCPEGKPGRIIDSLRNESDGAVQEQHVHTALMEGTRSDPAVGEPAAVARLGVGRVGVEITAPSPGVVMGPELPLVVPSGLGRLLASLGIAPGRARF